MKIALRVGLVLCLALIVTMVGSAFRVTPSSQVDPATHDTASHLVDTVEAASEVRVGLQAGHWKNSELPDEFERLRTEGGGATVGAVTEWEVNLAIAQQVATFLQGHGVVVDILPATIPGGYTADAFISIHADGSEDVNASGFKVAAYEHDTTGSAEDLSKAIEAAYAMTTTLEIDPNITSDMTRYYAFNAQRYEHTVSPDTPGVIVETGFLTSAQDRQTIVHEPEVSAQGIANGILAYLEQAGKL